MGNSRSRIGPTSFKVFDLHTRVRQKNQREALQLRLAIRDLNIDKSAQLTKYTFARMELRTKLHELEHENGQRQMYKLFEQNDRTSRSIDMSYFFFFGIIFDSSIDTIQLDDNRTTDIRTSTTLNKDTKKSLLLYDLDESKKHQHSSLLDFPIDADAKKNVNTPFYLRKFRWASKLNNVPMSRFEASSTMSLKQYSEKMNQVIKIAIAKAARDEQANARRETRNNPVY
ncbi:unnamed protein product [Didymodactylos carnosus]|uniref:Uncharacterized protein n=1 Tax=Didymodactylos carnosus TaxID=1234261 RepID=A0A813ZIN8_9BILA|nr:unnamed protein product [Didymodactylos carnosus]CAF3682148.1 unnamed protein product [Didymodactylos carnosus]